MARYLLLHPKRQDIAVSAGIVSSLVNPRTEGFSEKNGYCTRRSLG